MRMSRTIVTGIVLGLLAGLTDAIAQTAPTTPPAPGTQTAPPPQAAPPARPVPAGLTPPLDYVIGAADQLSIVFWRDETMSTDVVVRPDGKISLPLINDVDASGLTPEQLRLRITELALKFVQDPAVSVVVKQINSRQVFIMGNVGKPGPYPLGGSTTVMQLIAMAGGLTEWAKEDGIVVLRNQSGQPTRHTFNYRWVLEGKNMRQNIELRPGDTVLVP